MDKRPQRLVDGLIRRECRAHVGCQQREVRPRAVALQILSADPSLEQRSIVLGAEIVVIRPGVMILRFAPTRGGSFPLFPLRSFLQWPAKWLEGSPDGAGSYRICRRELRLPTPVSSALSTFDRGV